MVRLIYGPQVCTLYDDISRKEDIEFFVKQLFVSYIEQLSYGYDIWTLVLRTSGHCVLSVVCLGYVVCLYGMSIL